MRTLIVYDNNGYVFYSAIGDVQEPVGVPFMWVEVEEGKYVTSVDVSGAVHVPVFEEIQKSERQQMDELKSTLESLVFQLVEGGVI